MMKCEGGKQCCTVHWVAWLLVFVGALNWGLVGLSGLVGGGNWNLVNVFLGQWMTVEAIVYLLVGASAIFLFMGCKCKVCNPEGGMK